MAAAGSAGPGWNGQASSQGAAWCVRGVINLLERQLGSGWICQAPLEDHVQGDYEMRGASWVPRDMPGSEEVSGVCAAHGAAWEGAAGEPQVTPPQPPGGCLLVPADIAECLFAAGGGRRHWQLPSFLVANGQVTSMLTGSFGA